MSGISAQCLTDLRTLYIQRGLYAGFLSSCDDLVRLSSTCIDALTSALSDAVVTPDERASAHSKGCSYELIDGVAGKSGRELLLPRLNAITTTYANALFGAEKITDDTARRIAYDIGELSDQPAAWPLIDILSHDPNTQLGAAMACHMWTIGAWGFARVIEQTHANDWGVRHAAVGTLGDLAKKNPSLTPQVETRLRDLFTDDPELNVRVAAVNALSTLTTISPASRAVIVAIACHDVTDVNTPYPENILQTTALDTLGEHPPLNAVEMRQLVESATTHRTALKKVLDSSDWPHSNYHSQILDATLTTLAPMLHEPAVRDLFVSIYNDTSENEVRRAVIAARLQTLDAGARAIVPTLINEAAVELANGAAGTYFKALTAIDPAAAWRLNAKQLQQQLDRVVTDTALRAADIALTAMAQLDPIATAGNVAVAGICAVQGVENALASMVQSLVQ